MVDSTLNILQLLFLAPQNWFSLIAALLHESLLWSLDLCRIRVLSGIALSKIGVPTHLDNSWVPWYNWLKLIFSYFWFVINLTSQVLRRNWTHSYRFILLFQFVHPNEFHIWSNSSKWKLSWSLLTHLSLKSLTLILDLLFDLRLLTLRMPKICLTLRHSRGEKCAFWRHERRVRTVLTICNRTFLQWWSHYFYFPFFLYFWLSLELLSFLVQLVKHFLKV